MRLVIKLDFSTSEIALDLGKPAFETELTRLYTSVPALKAWSKQGPAGRFDLLLCDLKGPREIMAIAQRIHESLRLRPIFLPQQQAEPYFGF